MNQGCSPVYIGRYHKDDSDGDQAPLREAPSGQRPVTARGRVEQTSPLKNDNRQVASSDVAPPDSSVIPGNPTSSQICVSLQTLSLHIFTGCTVSYRAVPCSAELPNWTGLGWAGLISFPSSTFILRVIQAVQPIPQHSHGPAYSFLSEGSMPASLVQCR